MLDGNFEEFWKVYPRKRNKKEAAAAYEKALKRAPHSVILRGAEAFARECDEKETPQEYIAHARTWLHNDRWTNPQEMTPERKGWVPVSQMTDGEKRRTAELLKKPYMKPEMLRLGPRSVAQLKAEGYL